MESLEEKIKNRLEGCESELPEGDFAKFKALIEKSNEPGRKTSRLIWLVPAAAAAALALIFTHGQDTEPGTPVTVAEVQTSTSSQTIAEEFFREAPEELPEERSGKTPQKTAEQSPGNTSEKTPAEVSEIIQKDIITETITESSETKTKGNTSSRPSTFIQTGTKAESHPGSINVGIPAAGILGSTGAIALIDVLTYDGASRTGYRSSSELKGWTSNQGISIKTRSGIESIYIPDERTYNDRHHLPIKAGLSLRIPISGRWSLTTGLDYTAYLSEIEYTLSGYRKQSVRYIGIPLRADYTITGNRWIDVYAGAGASVDCCLAATLAGNTFSKGEMVFSLIGAGGVQFNATEHLGIYLEPTLSRSIPLEDRILSTYMSKHPFMFYTSSGIRISL